MKSAFFTLIGLCWGLPLLWILLIPSAGNQLNGYYRSRVRLVELNKVIQEFRKEYNENPASLRDIEVFSLKLNQHVKIFDGYGQRFNYFPLNKDKYVIRSFGKDGVQNAVKFSRDLAITNFPTQEIDGVKFSYDPIHTMVYPIASTLGSVSSDKKGTARLYYDERDHNYYLLCLFQSDAKGLRLLIAPSTKVHEFFWVPGKNAIIYTSMESPDYSDGIYYWDLNEDYVRPMITVHDNFISTQSKGNNNFWISLASIDVQKSLLYAYIRYVDSDQLAPQEFFSSHNLKALSLPEHNLEKIVVEDLEYDGHINYFRLQSEAYASQFELVNPQPLQNQLVSLPIEGPKEEILSRWTEYCSLDETRGSPVFSYCLWYLTIFYGDAYLSAKENTHPSQERLRALGAELAGELAQNPMTPPHIRALSLYIYRTLLEDTYPGINFSHIY